jgi:putative ABC transport system substrate-binding protein
MRRREFVSLLGGAAAAWPLVARAQQATMPVICYKGSYGAGAAGTGVSERNRVTFFKGLAEPGYVEGRNVAVEYRWIAGQNERLPAVLRDLIERRGAVLAPTTSTAAALAAKAAPKPSPSSFGSRAIRLAAAWSRASTGRRATLRV